MDVLDNYKKAWGNQPEETNKLSKIDIYRMTQSKSSSIVKWIFIIGVLEFVILNSSYFFIDMEKANQEYKNLGIYEIVFYSQFVVYTALIYFLVQFYLNYKNISVVENTKVLMKRILKTRKTVKNYVLLNLGYLIFILIVSGVATINQNGIESTSKLVAVILGLLLVGIILTGIIWLFYQLLYGILLRKLKRNYKELAKLDELN